MSNKLWWDRLAWTEIPNIRSELRWRVWILRRRNEDIEKREKQKEWSRANDPFYIEKWSTPIEDHREWEQESERIAHDSYNAHFERDRDDYIRSDDRAYSNPISL